jgi:hypothetical protein
MKIQLTEKQLKNIIIEETRSPQSLVKRGNVLYKAIKRGKFNFSLFDIVYGNSQSDSTREITFKGTISYTLPDDYTIELVKDEDTFRLGIKRSGYNHTRFHINNPRFRFTGSVRIHDLDRDDVQEEHYENEPIGNIDILEYGFFYFKVFERLDKFFQQHYNVSIKRRNNTNEINEDKHSSKEVKKLIAWSMKHMGCYYTESTDGIKLCPPDYIKDQCRPTHLSDKALYPIMRDIAKWFGCTKHDVERAFRGNRPL